jgi:hypothetical protein
MTGLNIEERGGSGLKALLVLLSLACVQGCVSKSDQLNDSEKEALSKLDAEANSEVLPSSVIPESSRRPEPADKELIRIPTASSEAGVAPSSQCYEFKFYNQARVPLNRDPVTLCQGDPDRQVFLQSAQGRTAILNLSPDALIDPVAGITFVSSRKLLCFDHNVAPNARWPWIGKTPVINCCSDIAFERNESGNESSVIVGRVEGPPPNCGQD